MIEVLKYLNTHPVLVIGLCVMVLFFRPVRLSVNVKTEKVEKKASTENK